jgi:hypothetical protein
VLLADRRQHQAARRDDRRAARVARSAARVRPCRRTSPKPRSASSPRQS